MKSAAAVSVTAAALSSVRTAGGPGLGEPGGSMSEAYTESR
jgi:hypothetical protein